MKLQARYFFAVLSAFFLNAIHLQPALAAGTGTLAPAPFTYAATAVGGSTSQTFTVSNTLVATSMFVFSATLSDETHFTIVNDTCSGATIAGPAGTCTIDVAFRPQAVALGLTTTLIVATDATIPVGGQLTSVLDGDGTAAPVAAVDPASLAFGNVAVGLTSASRSVQLTNTGTTPLTVTSVTLAGTDPGEFTILNETCSSASPLPPATDCIVEVAFAPASAAAFSASLDFVTDGGNPSVALTGTGIAGAVASADPAILAFGNVAVGLSSAALNIQLTNTGTSDLSMTAAPTITGVGAGEYAVVNDGCGAAGTLNPGEDCIVQVVYAPTAAGAAGAASLDFTTDSNDPSVTLTGTGVTGPLASATPAALAFGSVGVGNSSPALNAQLTNAGTTDLTITAAAALAGAGAGEYSIASDTCGTSVLIPGESCIVQVIYSPTALGAAPAATLNFTSDGGNPSVTLTGTGVTGPVANAAPATLAFGSVPVGSSSAALNVQLTNTGTDDLVNTAAPALSGAGAGQYAIANDGCATSTLQPNESCIVQVVYSPTAAGPAAAASLDFTTNSNDPSVALTGTGVAGPLASATPATLAFGSVGVGQSSGPLAAQLTNTGTTTLTITAAAALAGAGAGQYAIVNDSCGTGALEPAQSCLVQVVYSPTTLGAAPAATLNFTSDGGSPAVTLTGTGITGPVAAASPSTLAFGSVGVGSSSQALVVQLTNTGTDDLVLTAVPALNGLGAGEYAILNDGCGTSTLQPNEDCAVQVVYTPTAAGAAPAASLDFTTNANDPSVTLTGTGVTGPNAEVSPATLAFGNVAVGGIAGPLVAQLTNNGTTALTLSAAPVVTGSSDFAIVNSTCSVANTLEPGEDCLVELTYSPSAAGAAPATTLDFTTDGGNPQATLTGTGVVGPIASVDPGTLAFGGIPVGAFAGPLTAQLTNTGTTTLTLASAPVVTGSADFSIVSSSCAVANTLEPGEDCIVEVLYAPSAAGAAPATTLDFATDGGNPQVTLTGTGVVGPIASVDPATVAFGSVAVGSTAGPLVAQLTNTGTTTLTLSGAPVITGSGDFAIVNSTCSAANTLEPGEDCLVELSYSPSAAGAAPATTLDFATDGGNPSVTLTGTGVVGPIATVNNVALAFGTQQVATSSQARVVQLTNTGTTVLTITGVALGGANPGEFQILNETCTAAATLDVGEDCVVEVLFAPTTAAAAAASLDFTTDGGNPSVTLTGTGVDASLSANTPVFPDTLAGATSAVQTVTVSNAGGAAIALIGTVSLVGADPDHFEIISDNCSNTSVAGGGSCDVDLAFSPESTGSFSATLSIPSNATASPLTVALAGNGVAPVLVVTPAEPFDYGSVPINDPALAGIQTFTLDNTSVDPAGDLTIGTISLVGSNPDQFTIVEDDCSNTVVSFGSNCTLEVAFLPTATGLQQAALSIPSNDPANPVLEHDIEGTGIASAVSVTPASPFDFLTVPVDTASAPQTFTVENTGTAPLALGQLALVGANPFNFAITADACSNTILAPAATCDYDVTFFPDDDVAYTATVSIPSNDPASPFSYTVTGTGIIPGLVANPANLAFGNQDVATSSAPQTVTLSNTGAADVTVANVSLVGTNPDDFEIVQDACSGQTLIPAGTCQVRGVFSPESAGAKNAALLVLSDDADNPFLSVALTGTGIVPGAPLVSLAPTVLDFDNVEPNTATIQSVTLTNIGTGTLTVSAVAVGGSNPQPFSNSGDCVGANLGAGQSCTEAVTFAPSTEENFNAVLNFTTNVPQQPSFVVLIGSSAVDNSGCALGGSGAPGGGKALGYGFLLLCLALAGAHRRWARDR